MKNKIVIIEDNFYKYYTMKHLFESKLRIRVQVLGARTRNELLSEIDHIKPNIVLFRPCSGVAELLEAMRGRRAHRLNTEIVMLITHEISLAEQEDLLSDVKDAAGQCRQRFLPARVA